MQSTINIPGMEEITVPEIPVQEIPVRHWPSRLPFEQMGNAGRIALLASHGTEIDPHAVLFSLLTVVGCVIGPDIHLYVGEARHYCRLFCVLVGASSRGRKGSSLAPILSIFQEVSPNFMKIRTSGPLSSGEGLIYRIRDASEEVDKEGDPLDPGVEDKRLVVLDGEFAAALRAMKRETNTLSAILRSAWDSGDISPLTKTNPVRVTNGHVCFVSHITTPELHACLSESDSVNGFANRILWICTRRQGSVPFPERLSKESRGEIGAILSKSLSVATETREMTLSLDAKALFGEAYPILTQERPGLFGSATSRAEAQVMRMAMILALLDGSPIIRREDMVRSLHCWRYSEESARFIFGDREPDQRANKILDFLSGGERTTTQITVDLFKRNVSGISEVLEYLQSVGKITCRKECSTSGKKPATYWKLAEMN
jgi:hypothetical protein